MEDGTCSLGVSLVDSEPSGVRVRRKAVIGTVLQYPNLENAWQASNGLRASINETRNRQREQAVTGCTPALGAGGPEFKSRRPDQKYLACFLLFIESAV